MSTRSGNCQTVTSADAEAFARLQHVGQVDKVGEPYLAHLERVTFAAERRAQQAQVADLAPQVEQVTQAAWLHHVVEDTSVTPEELRTTGRSRAPQRVGHHAGLRRGGATDHTSEGAT